MDWINTIWQKVNKPLYFLFVGGALLLFAPQPQRWTGFVFVAFGAAGTVEWFWKHGVRLFAILSARRDMRKTLECLNPGEREVMLPFVAARTQSFYLDWHQYHGVNGHGDSPDEYQRLVGVYKGLGMKGVLGIHAEDTMANFQFLAPAWDLLLSDRRRHNYSRLLDEAAPPD